MLRLLSIIMLFSSVALGHSGRTDSIGGHNNTQEGNYHFHSGPLAGQTFDSKEEAEVSRKSSLLALPLALTRWQSSSNWDGFTGRR